MAIYEVASEYRIAILFPDTSPRGAEVEKIENIAKDWWFGLGAGFYVNATEGKYSPYF
jgi:S-formylglutathione hydrolase